jgi:hypothetical protein
VSDALHKQLTPLMHDKKDAKEIEALIKQMCDLPFPVDLGMVDSREYDTMCAGIIGGLQKVIRDNGGVPGPLPPNAPKMAKTVRNGMLSWQEGGSARAYDKWQADCVQESKDAQAIIDSLDSTAACKDALAKAYAGDAVKGLAKNWKRVSKEKKDDRVIRTFEAAGEQAQVIFDPSEDEPEQALRVYKEAPTKTAPGQFPKIFGPDLNGSVLFSRNNLEDDEVSFYCGPQETNGCLSDRYDYQADVQPVIESIIGTRESDLYCAENYHSVKPAKGETVKELAAYLDRAMKAAGAVVENENDIDL